MKLLIENWREYLNENENAIRGTVPYTQEVLNTIVGRFAENGAANLTDHTAGHVSSRSFKKFDPSKTGANTAEGEHGGGKYNLDSYFGPMFGLDKKNLSDPDHIKSLGGKYMLTVKLNGKYLKMNIDHLVHYFPQSVRDPNNPSQKINTSIPMTQSIQEFKKILEKAGFDGIWWSNPGRMTKTGKLALTSNAISVFDPAKNVEITAIRNLSTGQEEWRKQK